MESRKGAAEIRAKHNVTELADESNECCRLLKAYDKAVQAGVQATRALEHEKYAHFNGGTWHNESQPTPTSLTVPNDLITANRNDWIKQALPTWYKSRVREFYCLIPYLDRILEDYDSKQGQYWQPPTIARYEDIPETIRDTWLSQNLKLAQALTPNLPLTLRGQVIGTYTHGASGNVMVTVDKQDGLAIVCSLMSQASPHSSEYKTQVDKRIHDAAERAKTMGDPTGFVKELREDLDEANRLNIGIRWHVGQGIITALSCKHRLFARAGSLRA